MTDMQEKRMISQLPRMGDGKWKNKWGFIFVLYRDPSS